jgi:hypothetical protein
MNLRDRWEDVRVRPKPPIQVAWYTTEFAKSSHRERS